VANFVLRSAFMPPVTGGDGAELQNRARHSNRTIERMCQARRCSRQGLRAQAVTRKVRLMMHERSVMHALPSGLRTAL